MKHEAEYCDCQRNVIAAGDGAPHEADALQLGDGHGQRNRSVAHTQRAEVTRRGVADDFGHSERPLAPQRSLAIEYAGAEESVQRGRNRVCAARPPPRQ